MRVKGNPKKLNSKSLLLIRQIRKAYNYMMDTYSDLPNEYFWWIESHIYWKNYWESQGMAKANYSEAWIPRLAELSAITILPRDIEIGCKGWGLSESHINCSGDIVQTIIDLLSSGI